MNKAYEYTLTLEQEVAFMWSRRLSPAKILFFVNRYIPLVVGLVMIHLYILTVRTDPTYCHRLFLAGAALLFVDTLLSMGILFLRAYAVWPSSKFIPWFLVAFITIAITIATTFMVPFIKDATVISQAFTPHGCVISLPSESARISLIVFIIYDTVALSFIVAKIPINFRDSFSTQGLLAVIIADGIGYYICITAISIANLVIFHAANLVFRACLVLTQVSLQNILCNRLLLHVHAVNAAKAECPHVLHLVELPGRNSA